MNRKPSEEFSHNQLVKIATVCHEAIRSWSLANGSFSYPSWDLSAISDSSITIACVRHRIDNPKCSARDNFDIWREGKRQFGWVHGRVKDSVRKTHPSLMAYEHLPMRERKKAELFIAIVDVLKDDVTSD